jgi:mRNA-degrading endonuclease toxin of MazEF toxin-antitoxin module
MLKLAVSTFLFKEGGVTSAVTSTSAIFTHRVIPRHIHLDCTRGYGNLHSQITLRDGM